jgi:hypothetical protein
MKGLIMKAKDIALTVALAAMGFSVLGAFFDVITAKEAVMLLAAVGLPLTVANKLLA